LKVGAGKLKFVSHGACLLSTVGSEICNVPAVWIGNNQSDGIDTFDIWEFNPFEVGLKVSSALIS